MERISEGRFKPDTVTGRCEKASGVCFLNLPCGEVKAIDDAIKEVPSWDKVKEFSTTLKVGSGVGPITSSLNRYGQFIVQADGRSDLDSLLEEYEKRIASFIELG